MFKSKKIISLIIFSILFQQINTLSVTNAISEKGSFIQISKKQLLIIGGIIGCWSIYNKFFNKPTKETESLSLNSVNLPSSSPNMSPLIRPSALSSSCSSSDPSFTSSSTFSGSIPSIKGDCDEIRPSWLPKLITSDDIRSLLVIPTNQTEVELESLLKKEISEHHLNIDKDSKKSAGKLGVYGYASRRGARKIMEDVSFCWSNFSDLATFQICDGHSEYDSNDQGKLVADYIMNRLFVNNRYSLSCSIINNENLKYNIEKIIFDNFIKANHQLKENKQIDSDLNGTTAIMAIFKNRKVYIANVGDSRAVLSSNGKVIPLSSDHKPIRTDEKERIKKAGGFMYENRLSYGGLEISRSFGNFIYNNETFLERPILIPDPEIQSWDIIPDDDFLILASKGLWNQLTNEEAVNIVKMTLSKSPSNYELASETLRDVAFNHNPQESDNITVFVIDVKNYFYN